LSLPLFADHRWFDRAFAAVVQVLPNRETLDLRVQYDLAAGDDHTRWVQVFVDGQLLEMRPGELSGPDIEIHWNALDALEVLAGRMASDAATTAAMVVCEASAGTYRGPAPPLDLAKRPELADLPAIDGVTLNVQHRLSEGPFGDLDCAQVFVDGRLNRMVLDVLPAPDVEVEVPYRAHVLLRQGKITPLDALQQGRISGSIGSLGAYAGVLESDAFQRAQRACAHEAALALATLGEISATPGYREAIADATRAMEQD
jgi:hypothetical protein